MSREHHYSTSIKWTGDQGTGTSGYKDYERNHAITAGDKEVIQASSDPAFRGDGSKYNPEELLVAALSSCHMLWYLHLCADVGVVVVDYTDNAKGVMEEVDNGGGKFKEVTLYPDVIVKDASMIEKANALHDKAHEKCFIANSCNFPVLHSPRCGAR
ncbi:MAG TPA: OsmC family protein [Flavipsychrobacter sp.]|nr:OsmC family protein [Flavipsychrobacter sp.]